MAIFGAALWVVFGIRRRRRLAAIRQTGAMLCTVFREWLILIGSLVSLGVLCGFGHVPLLTLMALLPNLMLSMLCQVILHLHQNASWRTGNFLHRALIIGEARAVTSIFERFNSQKDHDYDIVGACLVGDGRTPSHIPVVARLPIETPSRPEADALVVLSAATELAVDLALVAPGLYLPGERLKRLSWAFHDRGRPIAILTGVIDVAHRRVFTTSAAGVTLLHVSPPLHQGIAALLKRVLDRVGALSLIVILSPLLVLLGIIVRVDSPGPAIFRQMRVGRNNKPFAMWKFRTMVVDAEMLREELETANENDGHMFKIRKDPRVTRVGRFLRRYSLDELPQLVNVLAGDMSLVGPRPPIPEEVSKYNGLEVRRLAVKPGLTGLWQVSGRADLSWKETVALDLRYVENWSLAGDISLIMRTVRAVALGEGAY
ncbi:sugar transferase [Streptomyces sp. 1222.5]|uniref:sugar transferase n=1 Tax=Streptomyces sp. 1222.5 TaxID=1881026 RepID=UPI003D711F52